MEKSYAFQPQINKKSNEILMKKSERSRNSSRNSSRESSRDSREIKDLKSGYKISTGLGVIDRHRGFVNTLQVNEKNKDFINYLDNM